MSILTQKSKKGFTLLEMLVSVSIMTIIASVVLFNYADLDEGVALRSAAQELVIAVRQAQSYGLAVKETAPGSGLFNSSYGVYFDLAESANYYIFVDTNNNKKYDKGTDCGSASTECVEKITLRNGVRVGGMCNGSFCPPPTVEKLNVTFHRPNPDAHINFTTSADAIWNGEQGTGKVILASPNGTSLTITIESTGQIGIQ